MTQVATPPAPLSAADMALLVELCVSAHDAAAWKQFRKDGSIDCGSCGGMMLGYRANTRFAKAIVAAGKGYVSSGTVYVSARLPEGICTQHAEVQIQGLREFKAMAEAHGIQPSKSWTFTD